MAAITTPKGGRAVGSIESEPSERRKRRESGTVVPKGPGKFLIRWTEGYDDGKQVRRSRVVYGTKTEALNALNAIVLARRQRQSTPIASKVRVGEWLETWLQASAATKAHNTLVHYRKLSKHIPSSFLSMYLRDVEPRHVRDMLTALTGRKRRVLLAADGSPWTAAMERDYQRAKSKQKRDKLPLGSPRAERRRRRRLAVEGATIPKGPIEVEQGVGGLRTVAGVRSLLRAAFMTATQEQLMARNPARGEYLKAPEYSATTRRSCTEREAFALLQAADEHPRGAFVLMMLTMALRPSELLALRWEDIEGDRVSITRAITRRQEGGLEVKAPKTRNGTRELFITDERVHQALARELAHQRGKREAARVSGITYHDDGFIFATEVGTPFDDGGARRRLFEPVARVARETMLSEAAERGEELRTPPLQGITPYNLRHTAATMALRAGVDRTFLSKALGHANPEFTARQYVHSDPADIQRTLSKLTAFYGALKPAEGPRSPDNKVISLPRRAASA